MALICTPRDFLDQIAAACTTAMLLSSKVIWDFFQFDRFSNSVETGAPHSIPVTAVSMDFANQNQQ
jgi:hypothetical protein